MWKKYFFRPLFCFAIILFITPYLFALDMGMSVTGEYNATQKADGKFRNKNSDWRSGYNMGANFVLDTMIDKNQLFNYRFGLGYQNVINDVSHRDMVLHRIMWTNTIGIGIIRQENFRFWIGPQIAMSMDFSGHDKETPGPSRRHDHHGNSIMGYIGPVAGLNITPINNFSFIFEIGGRAGYGASLNNLEHHMTKLEPFANIGFLYRVGQN